MWLVAVSTRMGGMADVGAVGAGSEVDVASACVGYGCVSEGEGRWVADGGGAHVMVYRGVELKAEYQWD